MNQKNANIGWGRIALILIVLHFSLIFVYALPESLSNSTLKAWSKPYVEPIFTQTWGMFSPCPTLNGHVELRYKFEDGLQTKWASPTETAEKFHSIFPGLHYAEIVLAESNLVYWLSLDLNYLNIEIGDSFPIDKMEEFYTGYSYFIIRDYVFGNAAYLFNKKPIEGEIRFAIRDVVSAEEGTLTLPIYTF